MDPTALVTFLQDLSLNNNKTWFDANRTRYDSLRGDFTTLVADILARLQRIDPTLDTVTAAGALFRINRDVRFSKDKSPYKTSFSAMFSPNKRGPGVGGYYFHIDADGDLFSGAGLYQPPTPALRSIRAFIADDPARFAAVVEAPDFRSAFGKLGGETLKTVPRDFPADHPAGEYLKHKSFFAGKTESAVDVPPEALVEHISATFERAYPLILYIRSAVG